jgi:hypothetical protein
MEGIYENTNFMEGQRVAGAPMGMLRDRSASGEKLFTSMPSALDRSLSSKWTRSAKSGTFQFCKDRERYNKNHLV